MWQKVTTPENIDHLLQRFGWFHDGCLREMHIWTGVFVDEELTMTVPDGADMHIRMLLQRQFHDPSAVELLFEQVSGMHLAPASCDIIIGATLRLLEGGAIYRSDDEQASLQAMDTTWVTARSLSWRDASDWMGPTLRYGPGKR